MTPQQERNLGKAMKSLAVSEGHITHTPLKDVTSAMCRIIEYLDGGTMTVNAALSLAMSGEEELMSQAIDALDKQDLAIRVDDLIVWQQEADEWLDVYGKQGRLF